MNRTLLFAFAASLGASCFAADYTLAPDWSTGELLVIVKASAPVDEFWIPKWREGDYEVFPYGDSVGAISFFRKGNEVESTKADGWTWKIKGGADEARYRVRPTRGNFSPNLRVANGELWASGPVFGVLGPTQEQMSVSIARENDLQKLYVSLPVSEAEGVLKYKAGDYTELLDSPMLFSNKALSSSFIVDGKEHRFVAFNRTEGVDAAAFARVSQPIVEAALALFGSLPYKQYTFFADFGGGGGGLEHCASTRLGMFSPVADASAGLISHEYFHCFNVKRIVPEEFRTFDFRKPPTTTYLWWLEGVTDYYSEIQLARSGQRTKPQTQMDLSSSIRTLEMGNAKNRVTMNDSSRRVWESHGSSGYGGLSYYLKGKVVGFALDLSIRSESKGKESLDSVIRTLYDEAKTARGFESSRIPELMEEKGGPKTLELYKLVSETTKDIPWSELLKPFGLLWVDGKIVSDPNAEDESKARWQKWPAMIQPVR